MLLFRVHTAQALGLGLRDLTNQMTLSLTRDAGGERRDALLS
jgi:hypothetical protein